MGLRTGLAIAYSRSGATAARLAATRAKEALPGAEVAMVVSSAELDPREVRSGLESVLGPIPVFGASAQVSISNAGQTRGTVSLLLMQGEGVRFPHASALRQGEPSQVARELALRFPIGPCDPELPLSALLVGAEVDYRGSEYLAALARGMDWPVPLVGGGAVGPPTSGFDTFGAVQYCGDRVLEEHFAVLGLQASRPGALGFGYAYQSCWSAIAPPVTVTRAKGERVLEVDHRPLVEYLGTYLGEDFRDRVRSFGSKYTFLAWLEDGDERKAVVRTPHWSDMDESIPFFPADVPEGTRLELIQVNRDELVDGAGRAARRARDEMGTLKPQAVFMFSCQARRDLLHSRGDDEIDAVRTVFGPEVPVFGFYAGGEYAPLYGNFRSVTDRNRKLSGSRLLSTSISLLAVGGPEPVPDLDLRSRLIAWLTEDRRREHPDDRLERRIEELTGLLATAERNVDSTETAFHHVTAEHSRLARELKERNAELSRLQRRSERLQKIVRQYTPHTVWEKAHRSVDAGFYTIPDEEACATLMFLDVKGFTTFAEKHAPGEVIRELNRIFEPATAIVYEHGGDVDKFIGDCIFARFPDPAEALECGLEIQAMARVLRHEGSPFSIRIGINTGRVISGNVGGTARRDNTLIGDAVNLAQRLESNCTPGNILLSRSTFEMVRDRIPSDVRLSRRDIKVKGKDEEVEVFEIAIPVSEE